MAHSHDVAFVELCKLLDSSPIAAPFAKPGFGAEWTGHALTALDQFEPTTFSFTAEAREVDLAHGITHTFLAIEVVCGFAEVYFIDGTGTAEFFGYKGPEATAPGHLQASRLDPIQRYREVTGG
jgi:hypothetical protein